MKQIIKDRQSITDVAVQSSGSPEAAIEIARLNNLNVTADVEPGTLLEMPEPVNKRKAAYYAAKLQNPAMKIDLTNKPGGIGYMQVGTDFIVS